MPRLFVAAWLPPDVHEAVAALPRPEVSGLRWVDPATWHITLRFLGDTEVEPVAEALDRADLRRARAVLGPCLTSFGDRYLAIPVSGLDELAAAVVAASAGVGRPPDSRPFKGHVTLGRLKPRARAELCEAQFDAVFDVVEVALVESRTLSSGAEYRTVGTWPTV